MSEAAAGMPEPACGVDWQQISPEQVAAIAPVCSTPKLRVDLESAREAEAVTPGVVDALEAALDERDAGAGDREVVSA